MPVGEWLFWLWLVGIAVAMVAILALLLTGRAIERRLSAIQGLLGRLVDRDETSQH